MRSEFGEAKSLGGVAMPPENMIGDLAKQAVAHYAARNGDNPMQIEVNLAAGGQPEKGEFIAVALVGLCNYATIESEILEAVKRSVTRLRQQYRLASSTQKLKSERKTQVARSPITPMVAQFQSLTPDEQKIFLDQVDPQPEPTVPAKQKRARKKKVEAQKRGLPQSAATATIDSIADGVDIAPCTYQYPKDSPVNSGMICGDIASNGIHDPAMGYAGYHEFEAPKGKKKLAAVQGSSAV